MPLWRLHYHLVWATYGRETLISEAAEQMIRRFKKACEKEGLTKDIKRVAYYEKPSEKRRRRSRGKPRMKPLR